MIYTIVTTHGIDKLEISEKSKNYIQRRNSSNFEKLSKVEIPKERYNFIRDAAWKTLIHCNVSKLPIDSIDIATKCKATVATFSQNISVLQSLNIELNDDGICIPIENRKAILFYNDNVQNIKRRNFTILHELGHFVLNNFEKNYGVQEVETNMYAARIAMPAGVLFHCNANSPKDIETLCGTSQEAALKRWENYKLLLKRRKFETSELERKVLEQFKVFIEMNKL